MTKTPYLSMLEKWEIDPKSRSGSVISIIPQNLIKSLNNSDPYPDPDLDSDQSQNLIECFLSKIS